MQIVALLLYYYGNTALVPCDQDHASNKILSVAERPSSTLPEISSNDMATSAQETTAPSLSLVWQSVKLQEVSGKAARIITN